MHAAHQRSLEYLAVICAVEQEARAAAAAVAAPAPTVLAGQLGKSIDERQVLHAVDLAVDAGEFIAMLGANGAGKSTLLKILAMLTPASQGSLQLFGEDSAGNSAALRGRIGLIGHQSMLYRDLTARENLVFFGRLYGLKNVAARVEHMLEVVDLADRGDDEVKAFSRGMTQRLAIARALLHEPQLLLADEPFAGLDVASVDALETLLRKLHQEGRTVVLVNHDIAQSLRLAQRVVVLRQGTIALDQFCGMLTAGDVLAEVKP